MSNNELEIIREDGLVKVEFNQAGDFVALNCARAWLEQHGFSCGSTCLGYPVGILKGKWVIAKWRNLTPKERSVLHGRMESDDFREGPIKVMIKQGYFDGC